MTEQEKRVRLAEMLGWTEFITAKDGRLMGYHPAGNSSPVPQMCALRLRWRFWRAQKRKENTMKANVIDTRGTKKHVRHLVRAYIGYAVKTQCGRTVKCFWDAAQTSYYYTNGERYSMPCRKCLPEDWAEAEKAEKQSLAREGEGWDEATNAACGGSE
jgi:hypothetical protein